MYLYNAEETEASSEMAFIHCLKQDINAFNLQWQIQK